MSEFNFDLISTALCDPVCTEIFRQTVVVYSEACREGLSNDAARKIVDAANNTWKNHGYLGGKMKWHGGVLPIRIDNNMTAYRKIVMSDMPDVATELSYRSVSGVSAGFFVVEGGKSDQGDSTRRIMHLLLDDSDMSYFLPLNLQDHQFSFPDHMSPIQARAYLRAYDSMTEERISGWVLSGETSIDSLRRVDLGRYGDNENLGKNYLLAVNTMLERAHKLDGYGFSGLVDGLAIYPDLSGSYREYVMSSDIRVDSARATVFTPPGLDAEEPICEISLALNVGMFDGSRRRLVAPLDSIKRFERN